jgi:UDP-N-acetylmuramoyl-tripeptide--D-alanyl-D-alanine ligase
MKKKILGWYYRILAWLAKRYITQHKPLVIGINGSVGKTSSRMIIAQTLEKFLPHQKIYTSPKNFNGELWLSLSIFGIESFFPRVYDFLYTLFHALDLVFVSKKKPYDILILEYGIDTPGEMDFLLSIVKPDIGVFTAIDSVHSEQFGDPGAIAKEEIKMILATKETAFLNRDDDYAVQLYPRVQIEKFSYQTEWYDSDADIRIEDELFVYDDGVYVTFDLFVKNTKTTIKTNMIGKAHNGYVGVALTIADMLVYRYEQRSILADLDAITIDYTLQPGRLSVFGGYRDSVIVDGSYNSSPRSVKKTIGAAHLLRQQLYPEHKILVVLGDMKELGDLSEQEHRQIISYVQWVADRVYLVWDMMTRFAADELDKIGFDMTTVQTSLSALEIGDALRTLLKDSDEKYILVFKGSQNTVFLEESIKQVLADPADVALLPRQNDWWMAKKNKFFDGLGK